MGCGCGTQRTFDTKTNRKSKFTFPKCISTYSASKPVLCMIPVDINRVLLGIENEIKLLDISSIAPSTLFTEHKGKVNFLLQSKNTIFASASQDKTIKIWDMNVPQSKMTLVGHTSMI